ncbi:MAG: hypothetical protein AAF447_06645 [Myxococcota bacterium]
MELSELRAAVEAAGPRGPGRKFAPELRRALVQTTQALWADGAALADIADALGIHARTAARYLDEEVARGEDADVTAVGPGAVALAPAGFVEVAVAPQATWASPVRVTTPDGFVVEGLDVEAAAQLIRGLR